jgi:hypothetical protein
LKTFEELFNNDKQPKVNNEEMKKLYTRVTGKEIPNTAQFCFMPFKEQSVSEFYILCHIFMNHALTDIQSIIYEVRCIDTQLLPGLRTRN